MFTYQQLHQHGLFDARVPRYTSYPPANHFLPQAGRDHQAEWLAAVPDGTAVSLYVHIPFCKRLCWFCACRTQGTKSMRPVENYIGTLLAEIARVRATLPPNTTLSRLHLGGGTPTILPADLMSKLLGGIFDAFSPTEGFEFSVEIDPTEAATDLLDVLIDFGMNRASVGVQDFNADVQAAIGRPQSFAQTNAVIDYLRRAGLDSLNMDLLYGLPHQTGQSLSETLQQVMALQPDRLALYGYAHVPWMSKRQVMIDEAALPSPEQRFRLTELARKQLIADGFEEIGIDHFARPGDGLTKAKAAGQLRRNFQGYTDDPAAILIGVGASAISRFPQGYAQNASATSVYQEYIQRGDLAGLRGYEMSEADKAIAEMIEGLMCRFELDLNALSEAWPQMSQHMARTLQKTHAQFQDVTSYQDGIFRILPGFQPLVRVIAASLDQFHTDQVAHSAAV